jgi:hypothetical protein
VASLFFGGGEIGRIVLPAKPSMKLYRNDLYSFPFIIVRAAKVQLSIGVLYCLHVEKSQIRFMPCIEKFKRITNTIIRKSFLLDLIKPPKSI